MSNNHAGQNPTFAECRDWLKRRSRVLIVTHQRPDGDAFGSLFASKLWLESEGIQCAAFVEEPVPERYVRFAPVDLVIGGEVAMDSFDSVLCLDSANQKRLGLPNSLQFDDLKQAACNLDHHVDNSRYGDISYVEPSCASTTELLTMLIRDCDVSVTPELATHLLLGIVTDTGGYRFNNTTATTFSQASWLMERGADNNGIMKEVFFSESISMLRLQARIFSEMRFGFDNRLAYFLVTPELLTEFEIETQDTEDLIETARVIKGADIVARLHLVDEGVRFSLRSLNEDQPILGLAHKLGGGGHKMAAGALAKGIDLEEGERLLLTHAKELFR